MNATARMCNLRVGKREKGKEEGGDFSFGESPRCKGIEGEMKNEK